MIVTGQTWESDIPHEPGEKITFRRLSWKEWAKAIEVRQTAELENLSRISGDMLTALKDVPRVENVSIESKYDKGTVLKAGIVNWTYAGKVNPENIDALDEVTADWAFEQVVATLKPRTDTEQKNG